MQWIQLFNRDSQTTWFGQINALCQVVLSHGHSWRPLDNICLFHIHVSIIPLYSRPIPGGHRFCHRCFVSIKNMISCE